MACKVKDRVISLLHFSTNVGKGAGPKVPMGSPLLRLQAHGSCPMGEVSHGMTPTHAQV